MGEVAANAFAVITENLESGANTAATGAEVAETLAVQQLLH